VQYSRLTEADVNVSDETLIENLKLKESDYLKRAAVLMFHDDPENWVFGAYVKVGYFKGAEIIYHDEIHGSLMEMSDKVLDLVYTKYFKGLVSYDGIHRIETYPVPVSAFREALLNAIIHKDYASNNPIQIRIYDDHVIIGNSGRLPLNWTAEDLLKPHISIPFNPTLANAFFRSGLIETWGRGIQRINEYLSDKGNPPIEYKYSGSDLMATFKVHPSHIEYNQKNEPVNEPVNISDSTKAVFALIKKSKPKTRKEIVDSTDMSLATVKRAIKELRDNNLIRRVGSDKSGYWEIIK
jgi:ATP-dependent DNA helicase RecG